MLQDTNTYAKITKNPIKMVNNLKVCLQNGKDWITSHLPRTEQFIVVTEYYPEPMTSQRYTSLIASLEL